MERVQGIGRAGREKRVPQGKGAGWKGAREGCLQPQPISNRQSWFALPTSRMKSSEKKREKHKDAPPQSKDAPTRLSTR